MAIVYDTHLHSEFSTDSHTPIRKQLEQAVNLGLQGVCMTDHMDYEFPLDQMEEPMPEGKAPFSFDDIEYRQTLQQLKKEFPSLLIGTGVECGLQTLPKVVEKNIALCKNPDWDYVIGSLHLVNEKDPYYPSFWEGKSPFRCVWTYFEKLLENLETFHHFDSLGHLDYIVRYAPSDFCYEPKEYREIIEGILKLLIRKDIALEVNSSALKSSCMPNPHLEILQLYASYGGELITIGSDAHTPDYMAYQFDTVVDLLKKAGLHEYVTFHHRKPTSHSLF